MEISKATIIERELYMDQFQKYLYDSSRNVVIKA